jgi:hypothetical protein
MPFNHLRIFREKIKEGSVRSTGEAPPLSEIAFSEPPIAAEEKAASPDEKPEATETAELFYEKNNTAIRIERLSQASDFWSEYEKSRPQSPFLRYVFDTRLKAVEALLSVRCIHQAEDTGHLICTEPITLGCYRMVDGRYEVFLAGENLSYETWSEATEKFSLHNGRFHNQLRPETHERFKSQSQADRVVFKKEYYELTLLDSKHYQVFETSRLLAARNFLLRQENMITERNRYILVETPKGILCRDMDGIHELS